MGGFNQCAFRKQIQETAQNSLEGETADAEERRNVEEEEREGKRSKTEGEREERINQGWLTWER